MNRRSEYKLSKVGSTSDGVELEPLGGKAFQDDDYKQNGYNGKYGAECSNDRQPRDRVAVCSQKRALCVTATVLGALLGIALVIAYAGGPGSCPCAGKMPRGYVVDGYNNSEPFEPIATNGQPFPYLLPFLPSNIKPNRYTLTIHPNLTTLEVKGQVSIEFHVEKEMNFIVLHAQNLNITEKALIGPKGFSLKIVKLLEYPPRQQIYIEFRDKLRKKSNYSLNLRWYSKLIPDPEGFYVDEYDIDGTKKLLAATILGPGKARKAFPCFDEPHLRAAFKISLFRDRFHIGLSNSIVHTTDDVGFYMGTGLLRDDFVETPPLPPDAISWVVSVFRRELLEPSSTYQTTTTTTSPISLFTTLKAPENLLADRYPLKRNVTAVLKKGLYMKMSHMNSNHHENHTTAAPMTKSESLLKENDGSHADDGSIKSAPSYTFYAPENILPRTKFILHTSRDILEHLQQWLSVPYPLSKLDFVALPSIEDNLQSSLGLISCKTAFLKTSESVTTYEYHSSANEIAEAILQQYFGGLISPKTWKQNWLWEGMIRYLSRLIFTPLQSHWPVGEMYLLDTTFKALDIDVLQGWESVLNGTDDKGENNEFYIHKSASILTMLHSAMGDENFRKCLGTFINTFKYQTAEPSDLWQICSKKANGSKNIKEMMNMWTYQSGFPLLYVTKNDSNILISQKAFKFEEFSAILEDITFENETDVEITTIPTTTLSPKEAKKKNLKWIFPINYVTDIKDVKDTIWLDGFESKFTLNDKIKWIKINNDQNGYYRVLYNQENWDGLIAQLRTNHNVFSKKDRMGLISDAFSLCHANLLSCNATLELISYLPKELNWGPMVTGIKHLEKWRKILKYSESYLLLAEFAKSIFAKSMMQIGWNDTGNDETRLLRPEVLLAAVLWEENEAIQEAKTLLHEHLTNAMEIPPNLRGVAYIGSVLTGELIFWQYCFDRYISLRKDRDSLDERLELLRALGVTKDAWLQNRLLSFVTSLPTPEIIEVLEAISSTPTGGAMACRFLQAKWSDLQKRFGRGSMKFAKVITAITKYGANRFDYDELKSLVERFGEGPGMQLLSMTLQTVAANVEWISRSQNAIYNWMEGYSF